MMMEEEVHVCTQEAALSDSFDKLFLSNSLSVQTYGSFCLSYSSVSWNVEDS